MSDLSTIHNLLRDVQREIKRLDIPDIDHFEKKVDEAIIRLKDVTTTLDEMGRAIDRIESRLDQ